MAGMIIEKEIANMATFLNYIYTNYKERTAFSFTAGNEQKEITYGAFAQMSTPCGMIFRHGAIATNALP